jgi:hypothetical protein
MAAGRSGRYGGAQNVDSVELYLHVDKAAPTITSDTTIDDESLAVDSIVDVAAGDVIYLCEDVRFYQSIVTSTAAGTINLATPLDFAFTTAADVYVGSWNLNLDGSGTTKVAHMIPPCSAVFEIYQITVSMTDATAMDSAKFGGLTALTNGILFRVKNGRKKNLALVVNNTGFTEFGFDVTYDAKPPAGVYGMVAKKNYYETNGVLLKIDGASGDEIECYIRDDLTGLTLMAITVNGRVI